ncbi:hypothetical protein [Streptomyces sp. NPDC002133]|uniref:hypothetical protein n=1 Tax=Streptomyces sp. NPDC002133 TaxID=3154409 RepID=UPI00331D04A3
MAEAHPERAVTNSHLVRNALSTLISKSLGERTKQGATVFYTALEDDTAAVSVPGLAAESAPAEEKVAAELQPARGLAAQHGCPRQQKG